MFVSISDVMSCKVKTFQSGDHAVDEHYNAIFVNKTPGAGKLRTVHEGVETWTPGGQKALDGQALSARLERDMEVQEQVMEEDPDAFASSSVQIDSNKRKSQFEERQPTKKAQHGPTAGPLSLPGNIVVVERRNTVHGRVNTACNLIKKNKNHIDSGVKELKEQSSAAEKNIKDHIDIGVKELKEQTNATEKNIKDQIDTGIKELKEQTNATEKNVKEHIDTSVDKVSKEVIQEHAKAMQHHQNVQKALEEKYAKREQEVVVLKKELHDTRTKYEKDITARNQTHAGELQRLQQQVKDLRMQVANLNTQVTDLNKANWSQKVIIAKLNAEKDTQLFPVLGLLRDIAAEIQNNKTETSSINNKVAAILGAVLPDPQ